MNPGKLILLVISLCFVAPVFAAGNDDKVIRACESFDKKPTHFQALYENAKALGKAICLSIGTRPDNSQLNQQYLKFAEQVNTEVATFFVSKSFAHDLNLLMQHFVDNARLGVDKNAFPSFVFEANDRLFYFDDTEAVGEINLESNECQQPPGCKVLFEALQTTINQYKKPHGHLSGLNLEKESAILKGAWIDYLDNARSQTLLDSWLTTYMELDYLAQDRLVEPMPTQWFLIHPSLVIENVSEAADGDQVSEALAIEWIGFNWWSEKTSPLGYPFGASLVSTFSDRAEIDDQGIGFMLHFNNSLSVGVTDHDGDSGWFVTLDVLSLFSQKKQRWEDYWKEKTTNIQSQIESKF